MYSGALMSAKLRQAAMAAASPAAPNRSETLKPRRSQARRQWSIQAVKGKVTTRCLWNACKALTVGVILILVGAAMATIGFYAEEKEILRRLNEEAELKENEALIGTSNPEEQMTIVNTSIHPNVHPPHISHPPHVPPIVREGAPVSNTSTPKSSPTSSMGLNKLSYVGPIVMGVGGFVIVAACVMTFEARDSAAKIVPARFRKTYPERPGREEEGGVRHTSCQTRWEALAVCGTGNSHHSHDPGSRSSGGGREVSRRAMTFAFIQFSKTLQTSIDSAAEYYDGRRGSRPHLIKCPSAPSLVPAFQQERRFAEPPRVLRVATRPPQKPSSPHLHSLAPNSLPRQAISMDSPAVREVYAAAYPAFIGTRGEEEMELGASATGVHQAGRGSQGSLALDLHLPQCCPITLAVRDQSRSPSTSRPSPSPGPSATSPDPGVVSPATPLLGIPGLMVDKQTSTSDHLALGSLGGSRDTWGSHDLAVGSSRATTGSFREARKPRSNRRVKRSETIDTASAAHHPRRTHRHYSQSHQTSARPGSVRSSSSRNGERSERTGRLQPTRSETARRHQFLRQHKVETAGSQDSIPPNPDL